MRSTPILTVLAFQLATSVSAQGPKRPPEPDRGPDPVSLENPAGISNSNGQFNGEAPGVPGALAVGQNPRPAPKDNSIHFDDVADALKQLVEKIVSAVDDTQGGSSDSSSDSSVFPTTATSMQQAKIPQQATPCTVALAAYASCSTAYNGTFSAVAPTVQAGCLCNVGAGFDFNAEMQSCYSYAQGQKQYRSYAGVMANATAACTCVTASVQPFGIFQADGCTASSTTTSMAASGSSGAGSGAGASTSIPSPTNSGAVGSFGAGLSAVMAAVLLGLISVLF